MFRQNEMDGVKVKKRKKSCGSNTNNKKGDN